MGRDKDKGSEFYWLHHFFFFCRSVSVVLHHKNDKKLCHGTKLTHKIQAHSLSGTLFTKAYCTYYIHTGRLTHTDSSQRNYFTIMQNQYRAIIMLTMIPLHRGTATSPCTLLSRSIEPQVNGTGCPQSGWKGGLFNSITLIGLGQGNRMLKILPTTLRAHIAMVTSSSTVPILSICLN